MKNVSMQFRGEDGWQVSFNVDYEDRAMRFYKSFEDTHKDVYNWCMEGGCQMPAEKVNLTIYFEDNEWEYLVQLSQRNKDETVSETVHQIILRELRTFLLGVIEGIEGHQQNL